MSQTAQLLDALKKALKSRGKTYSDVAVALDLSVASVKRLFSQHSLSLTRLETICGLLDMEITDLLAQVAEQGWQLKQLSESQERAIADDIPLLLVTVAVLNRLKVKDILERFNIDKHVVVQKLAWLDRQGFIELLPHDNIRLKTAGNFAWRADGPIQRFFQSRLSAEYFATRFAASGERLIVLNGMLSAANLRQFHHRMERLAQDFDELAFDDLNQPVDQRLGQTVVLAVRPWVFGAFKEYIR